MRRAWTLKYSGFTEVLPTRAFLVPLDEDEEIEVALGKGQSVSIKYKAVSELQPNGKRYESPLPLYFADKKVCRAWAV